MAKEKVRRIGKKMGKSEAKKWVKRYKKKHPKAETYGWLYGDEILEKLLKNDGCEGIWFFKGIDDDGDERLVLFPADEDGNILDKKMKSLGAAAAKNLKDDDDEAADGGWKCPPNCPGGLD